MFKPVPLLKSFLIVFKISEFSFVINFNSSIKLILWPKNFRFFKIKHRIENSFISIEDIFFVFS